MSGLLSLPAEDVRPSLEVRRAAPSAAATTGAGPTRSRTSYVSPHQPHLVRRAAPSAAATTGAGPTRSRTSYVSPHQPHLVRRAAPSAAATTGAGPTRSRTSYVSPHQPHLVRRAAPSAAATTGAGPTRSRTSYVSPHQPHLVRRAVPDIPRAGIIGTCACPTARPQVRPRRLGPQTPSAAWTSVPAATMPAVLTVARTTSAPPAVGPRSSTTRRSTFIPSPTAVRPIAVDPTVPGATSRRTASGNGLRSRWSTPVRCIRRSGRPAPVRARSAEWRWSRCW